MVLMAKWDRGRGAAADPGREGHLFRRRADDEPRADAASRPRQIRPLLADRHRRRRRAAAGRPRHAAAGELPGRPAGARATASPRPMPSAAAISGRITPTSPPRPAGRTSRSSSSPSWARATRHLPVGERGEIAIRSAANIRGYWRDPEATAAAFTADGYLKTGDIGYLDEDDYLFIVDRKKDIIIRGGENISCQEVEAAIYSHPSVSEACVFGVPDERLGEVPAAVVYSEEDRALDRRGPARLPRRADRPVQASRPYLDPRRAAAQARHRQDRQEDPEGALFRRGRLTSCQAG